MDSKWKKSKVLQAQHYYSNKFGKVVRIHGREVFVKTPFNYGQCFAMVFMEGKEFYPSKILVKEFYPHPLVKY